MSVTSRFGAVIDALVTLVDFTDTLQAFDGPPLTADIPTDYVIVGGTNDPDDDAGEFRQDWNGLGAKTRMETGEITCAVLAGSGDDEISTTRNRALGILAQVEDLLRADSSLGGVLLPGWAHITAGRPSQVRNQNGTYVRVVFTVSYQSKLGS